MKKQNGKLNFKQISITELNNLTMLKIIGGHGNGNSGDDGNGETFTPLSTVRCGDDGLDD